jgi:hypothetical protein
MKKCHKCQKEKHENDFPLNKTKKDGRGYGCLECQREYNKEHYRNNKKYYITKASKPKKELREWLKNYKVVRGCKRCGETHPACLQFHHIDPEKKEFTISSSKSLTSMKRLLAEIVKCEVLCANCHFKEHWLDECDGCTQFSED